MKAICLATILITLSACSSIVHKVTLVTPVQGDIVRVEQEDGEAGLYVTEFVPKKEVNRAPAALVDDDLSDREVYFLALYQQTRSFDVLLGKKPQRMNFCPAFHGTLIDYPVHEFAESVTGVNLKKYLEQNVSHYNNSVPVTVALPVLGLAYSQDLNAASSRDAKEITQATLDALEAYNELNRKELVEICDKGVTDKYFTFTNTVKYYREDQSFHYSKEALVTLVKMPLFANHVMLETLRGDMRFTPQVDFTQLVLGRSNTRWISQYVSWVKKLSHGSNIALRR